MIRQRPQRLAQNVSHTVPPKKRHNTSFSKENSELSRRHRAAFGAHAYCMGMERMCPRRYLTDYRLVRSENPPTHSNALPVLFLISFCGCGANVQVLRASLPLSLPLAFSFHFGQALRMWPCRPHRKHFPSSCVQLDRFAQASPFAPARAVSLALAEASSLPVQPRAKFQHPAPSTK